MYGIIYDIPLYNTLSYQYHNDYYNDDFRIIWLFNIKISIWMFLHHIDGFMMKKHIYLDFNDDGLFMMGCLWWYVMMNIYFASFLATQPFVGARV